MVNVPCSSICDTLREISKYNLSETNIDQTITTISKYKTVSDGIRSEMFMRISEINNNVTFIKSLVYTLNTFMSTMQTMEKNTFLYEKILLFSTVIFNLIERYGINFGEIH